MTVSALTAGETRPAPGTPVPLTYEQDRFHAQIRSDRWSHKNVHLSFEILGDLDTEALATAVKAFVIRHDALQLQMSSTPGPHLRQWIRPVEASEKVLQNLSIKADSVGQFSRYASALLSKATVTPWECDDKRPFNIQLLRYDRQHHALLSSFQNLVFDGRAHHLYGHEIWRDYLALLRGETPPTCAPSFAQAATRQRACATERRRQRARAGWQERLRFLAGIPSLPPRALKGTESGIIGAELPAAALRALRRTCAEQRSTVLQWTVSSFISALASHTGMPGVGLWTTVDSRMAQDRDTVGMFAGSCPLVIGEATAGPAAVRAQVRAQLLSALSQQQLTAGEVAALTSDIESECGTPVNRDIFVNLRSFHGSDLAASAPGPLQITPDAYPLRRIDFYNPHALTLRCTEFRDRLYIQLVFDGIRVDHPLAEFVLNDMLADTTATYATYD